jgi:hypothetical protein
MRIPDLPIPLIASLFGLKNSGSDHTLNPMLEYGGTIQLTALSNQPFHEFASLQPSDSLTIGIG